MHLQPAATPTAALPICGSLLTSPPVAAVVVVIEAVVAALTIILAVAVAPTVALVPHVRHIVLEAAQVEVLAEAVVLVEVEDKAPSTPLL